MEGRTVIITGSNRGIGKATAMEIAKRGARIILACRNLDMAEKVQKEIIHETKNRSIVVKKLDLSSQKSIREFAAEINKTESSLNVLLHNAGIMNRHIEKTEDNLELTMATNHFGPFLLTHLLIDLLKRSAPSRIVVVSSVAHYFSTLNLENINPTSSWLPILVYCASKYANICFTKELARRLDGTGVTANCLHPGLISTDIWKGAPSFSQFALKFIDKLLFKTSSEGSQTSVYLACSEEVKGVTGEYFVNCQKSRVWGGANDPEKAKKLWELSKKLANLQADDPEV